MDKRQTNPLQTSDHQGYNMFPSTSFINASGNCSVDDVKPYVALPDDYAQLPQLPPDNIFCTYAQPSLLPGSGYYAYPAETQPEKWTCAVPPGPFTHPLASGFSADTHYATPRPAGSPTMMLQRPYNGSDTESLYSASPTPSFVSPYNTWSYGSPAESTASLQHPFGIFDDEDEDDMDITANDRPYAALIYEALMQAPGHRMLLRDIYTWFEQNTNKAVNSGTNGWQNSIRHNLSMNQAFENDKSEAAPVKGSKKACSVWVLTEDAIKYGVQSTTRYRKNGSSKKSQGSRTPPAIERVRSGRRGGRAARRAAKLRKQEGAQHFRPSNTPTSAPASTYPYPSPLPATPDRWSDHSYSPTIPTSEPMLNFAYPLTYPPSFEDDTASGSHYQSEFKLDEPDFVSDYLTQPSANTFKDEGRYLEM